MDNAKKHLNRHGATAGVKCDYKYNRRNNCDTRKICRECEHFALLDATKHCCTCLADTGEPRDPNPTSTSCKTFMPRRKRKIAIDCNYKGEE